VRDTRGRLDLECASTRTTTYGPAHSTCPTTWCCLAPLRAYSQARAVAPSALCRLHTLAREHWPRPIVLGGLSADEQARARHRRPGGTTAVPPRQPASARGAHSPSDAAGRQRQRPAHVATAVGTPVVAIFGRATTWPGALSHRRPAPPGRARGGGLCAASTVGTASAHPRLSRTHVPGYPRGARTSSRRPSVRSVVPRISVAVDERPLRPRPTRVSGAVRASECGDGAALRQVRNADLSALPHPDAWSARAVQRVPR
jgi:hypothetical protein